jgi:hypothetical protein
MTHIHIVLIVREAVLTGYHWIQLILSQRPGRWMKMEAVSTFRMTEIYSNPNLFYHVKNTFSASSQTWFPALAVSLPPYDTHIFSW